MNRSLRRPMDVTLVDAGSRPGRRLAASRGAPVPSPRGGLHRVVDALDTVVSGV